MGTNTWFRISLLLPEMCGEKMDKTKILKCAGRENVQEHCTLAQRRLQVTMPAVRPHPVTAHCVPALGASLGKHTGMISSVYVSSPSSSSTAKSCSVYLVFPESPGSYLGYINERTTWRTC